MVENFTWEVFVKFVFSQFLFLGFFILLCGMIYFFICSLKKPRQIQLNSWKKLVTDYSYIKEKAIYFSYLGGLFFITIALARPQLGSKTEIVKQKGVEVLFAVDVSKSMLAEDLKPNRLKRAQIALNDLIQKLAGHRLGLIAFKSASVALCPLTLDYSALSLYIDMLDSDLISAPGTSLVSALKQASQMFTQDRLARKVLIVISDGGDVEDHVEKEAKILAEKGVKVYSIGIGNEEGEPIPIYNDQQQLIGHVKDSDGKIVLSKLNREALRKIAQVTQGFYFNTSSGSHELDLIFNEIQKLEFSDFDEKMVTHFEEQYHWFLLIGLILMIFAWSMGTKKNVWRSTGRKVWQQCIKKIRS